LIDRGLKKNSTTGTSMSPCSNDDLESRDSADRHSFLVPSITGSGNEKPRMKKSDHHHVVDGNDSLLVGVGDEDEDDARMTDDATSDDNGPEPAPTFQKSYAISEKISKGNYGVVYRARHRTTSVE
jgi:hypothetical protein